MRSGWSSSASSTSGRFCEGASFVPPAGAVDLARDARDRRRARRARRGHKPAPSRCGSAHRGLRARRVDSPSGGRGRAVKDLSRRKFLSRLTVGLTAGIGAIVGLPIVGYLLAPLFSAPPDDLVPGCAITDFPLRRTKLLSIPHPSPLAWAGQTAGTPLSVRPPAQ